MHLYVASDNLYQNITQKLKLLAFYQHKHGIQKTRALWSTYTPRAAIQHLAETLPQHQAMQLCTCAESTWPIRQVWATSLGKNALFVALVACVKRFEVYRGQFFFGDSNKSVCLRVAQVSKLAIFVPTMTIDLQIDCFTPCACVQGNKQSGHFNLILFLGPDQLYFLRYFLVVLGSEVGFN